MHDTPGWGLKFAGYPRPKNLCRIPPTLSRVFPGVLVAIVYFFHRIKKSINNHPAHPLRPPSLRLSTSNYLGTMGRVNEPFNNAEAAPQVLPTALEVGNKFDTFQYFTTAMNTWAVLPRQIGSGTSSSAETQRKCVSNVRAA
jgi:hypothetical protein